MLTDSKNAFKGFITDSYILQCFITDALERRTPVCHLQNRYFFLSFFKTGALTCLTSAVWYRCPSNWFIEDDCEVMKNFRATFLWYSSNQTIRSRYLVNIKIIQQFADPTGRIRPAKTQMSLRIRAVWSMSSWGTLWVAKVLKRLHADKDDWSVCADFSLRWGTHIYEKVHFLMSQFIWEYNVLEIRLIWVFVGHICQKIRFLTFIFLVLCDHGIHSEILLKFIWGYWWGLIGRN